MFEQSPDPVPVANDSTAPRQGNGGLALTGHVTRGKDLDNTLEFIVIAK